MRNTRKLATLALIVLLAPACSSYDMFLNAEERGDVFSRLVEAMT